MPTHRLNYERFNRVAVQILHVFENLSERGIEVEGAPSAEALNDFIEDARAAHRGEADCLRNHAALLAELERTRKARDAFAVDWDDMRQQLKASQDQLAALPEWLRDRLFEVMSAEDRARITAARQWVLVTGPGTDILNWVTLAQSLLKFKVSVVYTKNQWGMVTGTFP